MIIFTHHTGEPHAVLGAQVAATFFQRKLSIPSIVIGVERNFSREQLFRFIDEYYTGTWSPRGISPSPPQRFRGETSRPKIHPFPPTAEKIVAFSHLCGRKDLIGLAQELKQKGFITILGGPQARQDYNGEPDLDSYSHRFRGLKSIVDIAFQGPVDGLRSEDLRTGAGLLENPWTKSIFLEVDWSNLYTFSETLKKTEVRLGQVLSAIGCLHARMLQTVTLPPPIHLREKGVPELEIRSEGCIFCDVSRDKGYHGSVGPDRLMTQIAGLPEVGGRKIPFELIDEYPIPSLSKLLEDAERNGIKLSQVNLVCRVDHINARVSDLPEILSLARSQDTKIMFSSIGFESFSDRLLRYFCKGITVERYREMCRDAAPLEGPLRQHLPLPKRRGGESWFYSSYALG